MKKAILLFIILGCIGVASAQTLSFLNLKDAPLTEELLREVNYRNSLVRSYAWLPGTPTALPITPDVFTEDNAWEFDFEPYVNLSGTTTIDSLQIGWSQSSYFTVIAPYPLQRFKLRFVPLLDFFGTKPIWITLYKINGDGTLSDPVSKGINITVTNAPDQPTFHFPSYDAPGNVSEGYDGYNVLEDSPTGITINFNDIVRIYDGTKFNIYVTQTTFPPKMLVNQSETNDKLVTFIPTLNAHGRQYFIVTAVETLVGGATQFVSTTFSINVVGVNDPPVIDSYLPTNDPTYAAQTTDITNNQDDLVAFSVVASDVDVEPLYYRWTLDGTLNGIPFSNIVSTTNALNYTFNVPGLYALTCEVRDRLDDSGFAVSHVWNITVSPKGPWFDPYGDTFSTTQDVILTTPGVDDATIHYYTTVVPPNVLVPPIGTPLAPQVYNGAITLPIPPQDYVYTITAWFTHPTLPESQHITQIYNMTGKVAMPVFVETPGIIASNVDYPVHLTCSTAGAIIHYSSDAGSTWNLYNSGTGILLAPQNVHNLLAYASKVGWDDSDVTGVHVYDIRRKVVLPTLTITTFPLPDGNGDYCVCLHDSVSVDFTVPATTPPDATIYYSINGVVYTYNALDFPLAIYHTSTINWWAEYTVADPDYFSSEVQSFFISVKNRTRMTYWGGGNNSVFNPPAGTYQTPQDVYINTLTDPINAPIYYSLDGGTTYQLYNGGAIHVAASQTIEVYADPMPVLTTVESLHQTAAYNITGTLPTPIIAPDGYPDVSMYEADVNVSISLPAGDPRWAAATIYYTTDGSVPNATSSVYAGTIPLGQGHWYVNAIAILPTWINSAVATTQYMVKFLPPVTFMPSLTEHTSAINVQMYAYGAAQIRYTDDGSEPNGGSAVYDPLNPPSLTIDNNGRYSRTYKAKANLVGWITSETAEKTYTMIPTVPDPVITANIPGLVHATPIDVTITNLLAGVQIYYTLDGSDPSDTSTPYAGTFTLTTTTTVRAIAYKAGFETSQIVEIAYTIGNNIGALVFQPASATYYNPIDVTISTNPPAAQIYYTIDGSLPVVVGGVPQGTTEQYVGAIHLGYSPVSVTINAIAVLASWTDNTGSAIYRVTDTLTSPSIVPATSQFAVGTTVPVTITAPNGDIWYRVNGAAWQSYAGAFDVSSAVSGTITVEAKADVTDASWLASSISTAVYTFNGQLNAPIITPLAGTYSTGIMVKMLNYQDATIYYSIDNGVTYNEYTFGSVGFAVNENTTVKAYAGKANWQNSPVVTSVYSFKVPNPVFDRLSGSFDLPFDASLSVISGDPIYYTVNGSDPIMSNPNAFPYVNPIAVSYGYTRIRAMAHRANWISSDIVEVIYNVNGQLQTPVFSLMGGLYQDPQTVSISANPSNANIYYTTDGTEPDESSALYAGAISITEITTLKAKAYLATWVPSNVASADYDLQVKAITSTPPPNVFTVTQFITLQTATPGTIIRFTTDGSVPGIGSSIYSGAIEVSSNTRIRAIAYKNDGLNWLPSAEYDQTYSISQQVATPVLNLPGGVYTYAPVTVNITCATAGAAISYSYDGVNWLPYTIPLLVNETKMIYAKAEKLDWLTSNVNPAYYIISIPIVATPVFADQAGVYSLPGTYNNAVDVKITTSTPGAQIYYTLNGNDPTEADSHYLAPFTISATTIVKARAYSAPMIASGILTGEYRIEPLTVLSPIVIPEDDSNPFYESFYVYMFPRTTDSVIRYTTNGAEPTGTDAEYTTPVLINATTVIKAKAFKSGFESVTVTKNYVITGKVNIANVSLTPAAGTYSTLQTISSVGALNPLGAVLRYTTNGTDPIATSPLFGSLNPPLGSSLNLKVRGFKTDWLPSDVLSASYTFTGQVVLAANLFSLDPAPIYTQSQTITLNTVTTPIGATLRWTSDGSEPSQLSPAYISGQQIQIPSTTTIKVKGFLNGWADSIVKTATYTITGKVLLGTMLPDAGTFQNAQAISLGATVPADASVYYTTNGTDPTTASALYNNAAFNIDANDVINGSADVIVKVKGFKTNWDASAVLSRTYTFQAATPMFNVASGLYPDAQNLVLTTSTVGGVIHYTTDGSVPTLVSPTYVNPLLISSSVTVKARAFNGDYLPSTIASATYVIGTNQLVALPTFTPAAGTYATAQTIQINCATPGATIYYRTDGLDPTNFDTPFVAGIVAPLNSTVTIKARAYKDGFIASQVATATFVITNKVAPVVFNPAGGTYTTAQQVILTTATAGAYIQYSIDGGAVTLSTNPITVPVNSTMTIAAQALKDGWDPSDIETAAFTITNATTFNQPMLVPAPGTFNNAQSVTIASPIPPTAQVWYTLDGSDPTDPANPNRFLYAGAFMMDGNANLNVVAIADGWDNAVFANNIYTFNAQIPAYTPIPGYYANSTDVSINSGTSGATIYYTMNGDNPDNTSDVYGAPITINGNTTFKAYAWKAGYNPSPIVTGIYGIGGVPIQTVASPVFNPIAGSHQTAQSVNISTTTPGAIIRYTVNGTIPSDTVGELYLAPIELPLDSYTMIRAIAYMADGSYYPSPVVTAEYTITGQIADVVFTPPAGTYSTPQTVYLSCETLGVYFRYTLDGTEPDNSSSLYNTNGIYIAQNSSVVIKAKAYRSGWTPSLTGTAAYNVRAISFSLTPAAGTYNNAQSVSLIGLNPANADVVYSIDGSVPSIPYTGGISLNGGITNNGIRTLRVKATLDTWASTEVTNDYIFVTTNPTFSPPAGTYDSARLVTLSTDTSDATIKYTINGDTPSETVGIVYVAPITVAENMTLRAYAFKPGYISSNVMSGTYAIGTTTPVVANPVFNPGTTTSTTPLSVTIGTSTANATIYYTTNGDDPSLLSTQYTQAINIPYNSNVFIKAIAYRENWVPSAIVSANYVVTGTVADVAFNPIGGTYQSAQSIQLSTSTEGATIRYTTDGTEPNDTSPLYVAAIQVPLNTYGLVVTAKAFRNGWVTSQPVAHTYTVTGQVVINEQVFSPLPGSFTASPNIVLGTTNPAGAIIRYTTDGSDPSPTSNVYSPGAIVLPLASTTTVKIKAFLTDWTPSVIHTAVYTVTGQVVLAANMFDPPSGIYQTPQVVHLLESTIPPGALIRYTLNGGEPNELSPAYYALTGIAVNSTSMLRVKGFLNGWIPSETSIASYTITGQITFNTPIFTPAAGAYTSAQSVMVSGTNPANAVRRYTTDGSEPLITSPVFSNDNPIAIPLDAITTVKVKAFLDDWTPSVTETAVYNITGQVVMTAPVFSPSPDLYTSPIAVSINTVTVPANATIRYTTDGSDPNETSPEYTAPIQILANQAVTIRTRAYLAGWLPSAIATGVYNVTGQVLITGTVFTPDPAIIYTQAQNVVISTGTNPSGAVIRYTTDGNDPGETSPIYNQAIPLGLNTVTVIKVKAFKAGWASSPIYSATYTITGQVSMDDVVITPASGTYQTAQTISYTGSLVPNDAVIRYTTNGSVPTETSPIFTTLTPALNSSLDLRIRGFKLNWLPSPVIRLNYTFTGQVVLSTPMFTPAAGTYSTATSVTLNDVTVPVGATLRYTLDGIDPSESSPAYSSIAPIRLPMNATTTLKVRGFLANWTPSAIMSATYIMTGALDIAAPQFSIESGLYYTAQNVNLGNSIILGTATTATGATIRYTTNGSEPMLTSAAYDPATPIVINSTTTLKIKSFKTDWISSPTYTAAYTITGQVSIAGVTITPPAGVYQTAQTISSNGLLVPNDATLRYTTDGSIPVETSPLFSSLEPPLNSTLNLKLRGFKADWQPSDVLSASYTFTGQVQIVGTVFTLDPEVIYTSELNVIISTATNTLDAVIHYTTNGDEPNETSPVYSQPIPLELNSVTTIKAKAFKTGWTPSETYSAVYTITGKVSFTGTLFSLQPNTYTTVQDVQITATVNPTEATIHYTTDGSDPTEASEIYTTGLNISLPLNARTTIKARAFKLNWIASDVISGTYTITGTVATPVFSHPTNINYGAAFTLRISCATPGSVIRYTDDGSDVTSTSPAYQDSINIVDSIIIKAKAFKDEWIDSAQNTGIYTILLAPINVWAEAHDTHIRVLWNDPAQIRALDGFNVYRKKTTDAAFPITPLNSSLVNTKIGQNYYYDDYAIENNIIYQYVVTSVYDGVESPPSNMGDGQLISPNLVISETSIAYPNPAITSSTIRVVLSRNDNVQLSVEIFDFAGKKVRTLSVPSTTTNKVEVIWDLKNSSGTKMARGTYFARVVVSDSTTKQEKIIKIAVK